MKNSLKLSRRSLLKAGLTAGGGLLLAACGQDQTSQPSITATTSPAATPTLTPSPTATLRPTAEGLHYLDNVPLPLELESGEIAGIEKYLNAFDTTLDQLMQRLAIQDWLSNEGGGETPLLDAHGNPLAVVLDQATGVPLMYARQDPEIGWAWYKATLRDLANLNAMTMESIIGEHNALADPVEEVINRMIVAGELDFRWYLQNFRTDHWDHLLENWDSIMDRVNDGSSIQEFPFDTFGTRPMRRQANNYNLRVRAQHLLWGIDVIDSIRHGGYSNDEIEKIAEFAVKLRVNEFKDLIEAWDIADEVVNSHYYGGTTWNFWMNRLGGYKEMTLKVARWVKEVFPEAKLVIVEDHVLEDTFPQQPFQRNKFIDLLQFLKDNGVDDLGVVIENNFWIFDPPSFDGEEGIPERLRRILDVGYPIVGAETTIVISDDYPS